MVRPKRVGHIALYVKDVDASIKFYTEVLGFQISAKRTAGPGAFLTCGQFHHDLALFGGLEGAEPVKTNDTTLHHFAVQVENFQALKEIYQTLKEKGVKVDQATDHGVTGSIYVADPDGNRVEIFFDKFENPADGLAEMRRTGGQVAKLIL